MSSAGPRGLFKGMTTATSGVIARFPLLLPVRNSVASYGASAVTRTSDRVTCGKSGPVASNHVEPVTQDLGNQVTMEVVGSKNLSIASLAGLTPDSECFLFL